MSVDIIIVSIPTAFFFILLFLYPIPVVLLCGVLLICWYLCHPRTLISGIKRIRTAVTRKLGTERVDISNVSQRQYQPATEDFYYSKVNGYISDNSMHRTPFDRNRSPFSINSRRGHDDSASSSPYQYTHASAVGLFGSHQASPKIRNFTNQENLDMYVLPTVFTILLNYLSTLRLHA